MTAAPLSYHRDMTTPTTAGHDMDPELVFMKHLQEHLSNFGPQTQEKVCHTIASAVADARRLDEEAVDRAIAWATARTQVAAERARANEARRKRSGETVQRENPDDPDPEGPAAEPEPRGDPAASLPIQDAASSVVAPAEEAF